MGMEWRHVIGPWRLSALAVAATLTLLVACGGGSGSGADTRQATFQTLLETNGFAVKGGSTPEAFPIDLVDSHVIDSAAGNNATQPYKVLKLPFSAGVDAEDGQGAQNAIFRLRPDEAIVYVGLTPPPCDYFSFAPYLWVRKAASLVAKGDWLFAAVGDPLNVNLIKTEGDGKPFGKNTIVIFAADQTVYQRVAALAQQAGYPESMINSYILPPKLLKLGVAPEAEQNDSLVILVRSANFTDQSEGDAYLANDHYASVFRVTPNSVSKLDPYPTPPPRNRKAVPEETLVPGLSLALAQLEAAIVAQTPNAQAKRFESIRWFSESRDVLNETDPASSLYHQFVAGEGSDTTYLRTAQGGKPANFTLGTDDMVVVYGVNHAATGLATYSSISVYGDWVTSQCNPIASQFEYWYGCGNPIWNGVAGMVSHDFGLSAERYIPGNPLARYLYAVRLVRTPPTDKADKHWIVVPSESDKGSSYRIALDQPITIGYRAYLNPATSAGPDYGDIIPDRAVWFKLPAK